MDSNTFESHGGGRSFGDSATGSGMAHAEMGWVTASGVYDREQLELQSVNADAGRTIYPKTDEKQLDVNPGEFVFSNKHSLDIDDQDETSRFMPVSSSLNGLGSMAATLFPDDEEMQMALVMNEIEPMGVSGEKKIFSDRSDTGGGRDDFNVQLHGNTSQPAVVNIPPGVPLQLVPPAPSSLGDNSRVQRADTDARKAILEAIPYDVRTVQETISAHLRTFIHDNETYKKVIDPTGTYRKSLAWLNYCNSQKNTTLNTIMLGIYTFVKKGIFDVPKLNVGEFDFSQRGGDTLSIEQFVAGMSRNFGLLDGSYDSITNVKATSFREMYDDLARDIMATVHYDGTVANFGFGFDDAQSRNPNILEDGEIVKGSAYGMMLFNQLNHHLAHISATNDAFLREWSRVIGTCYEGATKGGTMHLLLNK